MSWGKPGRLSTAEAIAASLMILGREIQAQHILSKIQFGNEFLTLNKQPLDAYRAAKTSDELVAMQWEFFDEPELSDQ